MHTALAPALAAIPVVAGMFFMWQYSQNYLALILATTCLFIAPIVALSYILMNGAQS